MRRRLSGLRSSAGQSALELGLIMPIALLLVMGVVELSYALLDAHTVTNLSREGANLISRNTTLEDAATAMSQMSARPVNFADGSSKLIFSVVTRIAATGATNYNYNVLYQRYEYGSLSAQSRLSGGAGAFGPAPDYQAIDANNDAGLRITGLPPNLTTLGSTIYVAEIFTRHSRITPLDRLGVTVPEELYAIAYF